MKRFLGTVRHIFKPRSELEKVKRSLSRHPRKTKGMVSIWNWKIYYVDPQALLSSLELLVEKGWNDFAPDSSAPYILDCGANIGISILNYKRKYPQARIVAFEPDPAIIPTLRQNMRANHIEDVTLVDAAVWTHSGELDFYSEGADGSRLVEYSSQKTVKVKTVDLADYLNVPVDLIKVDIEGAELDVIPHIKHQLALVKNVIIECHVNHNQAGKFGELLKTLSDVGYEVSVNSIGVWRDLVRKPAKLPDEFDQYFLVTATRNN